MRPLLALQQPKYYDHHFKEFQNFEVIDCSQWELGKKFDTTLPIWLDMTKESDPEWFTCYSVEAAIVKGHPVPKKHLVEVAKAITPPGVIRLALCRGTYNHMLQLKDYVDFIALPNNVARSIYVTKETAPLFHFHELCNLDELRRYPIRSLHTSMHITAALVGIDLTKRERRPKKLPSFTYEIKLTDSQLDLARENAKAIREALDTHA